MKDQPLVSVIVPVYNVEKYLQECVESIVGQSYKNLEIILVDDGSPDSSGQMCDRFAKKDKRIKVVHKKNEGLNYARKSGFDISRGDFILFVDSDDLIHRDTVRKLLDGAIDKNVDLVIGGYKKFSEDLPALGDYSISTKPELLENESAIQKLLLGSGHENVLMMTAWGKLFRRNVIESLDWDASNYRSNEDEFMALQYYSSIKSKVLLISESFYMYRQNPDSITRATYKNSFGGKQLSKFDTVELIYQEAMNRLGNRYASLITVKFIYEFILTIHRHAVDDESTKGAIDAYRKYFTPKVSKVNEEILGKIDPKTRVQYEGLVDAGVIGCLQAKIKFIEQENIEFLNYIGSLEKVIASKDESIETKDKTVNNLSRQIERLENHPGVRAGRLYHRVLDRFKKAN